MSTKTQQINIFYRLCKFMLNQAEKSSLMRSLRLNRPASMFLMVWPMLWGFLYATNLSWYKIIMVTLLAIVLRATANLYEDFNKNDFTSKNSKTSRKPETPSLIAILLLLFGAFILASYLNPLSLFFTIIWVILMAIYPIFSRISWWPQLYSGLVFGALPVMIAHGATENPSFNSVNIIIASFFWLTAVETLKADETRTIDLNKGFKSIAILLGKHSIHFVALCLVLSFMFLVFAGIIANAGGLYYGILMIAQAAITTTCCTGKHSKKYIHRAYATTAFSGFIISLAFLFI